MIKPRIPLINWNNQITKGLVFDAPLFEGGGTTTQEIITKTQGSLVASGATWDTNITGIDLDFNTAASAVNYTSAASVNSLTVLSIEALVYYRGAGGGGLGRIMQKKNATNGYFQLFTGHTAGNQLTFQTTRATTNGFWDYNMALPSNLWTHVVVSYDGSNVANNPSVYVNGVLLTANASTAPVGALIADDTNLYIGNRGDGLRNWNGKISYGRMWNRLLNAQEAKSLYTNPWQIYVRPNFYQPLNLISSSAQYYSFLTTLGVG